MRDLKYILEFTGSGTTIEALRKAYDAPAGELEELTPEERAWVDSLGLNIEEYQRQRLAEKYYLDFMQKVVGKLVLFVQEELRKAHIDFEVSKVICEFDRVAFRIFLSEGHEVRSFRVSWEDGTDYFEGNDVVAEQHIRDAVVFFQQATREAR